MRLDEVPCILERRGRESVTGIRLDRVGRAELSGGGHLAWLSLHDEHLVTTSRPPTILLATGSCLGDASPPHVPRRRPGLYELRRPHDRHLRDRG